MTSVSFLRHNSFFSPEDVAAKTLNIIGVGATGSWVGLLAAKMGWHQFRVWDLDLVESHNCPNQIYDLDQVGKKKVDAFEEVIKRFNPQAKVTKHDCFFESSQHIEMLEDAVFVAVDSLSARKDIFSSLKDAYMLDIIFETRMGFDHAELNMFFPTDEQKINNYLDCLRDDSEVQESACNARIITTLTNIVSSTLVHSLCSFYSSTRREVEFNQPSKTIFHLTANNFSVNQLP